MGQSEAKRSIQKYMAFVRTLKFDPCFAWTSRNKLFSTIMLSNVIWLRIIVVVVRVVRIFYISIKRSIYYYIEISIARNFDITNICME